jgi:hypothetical protein
MSLMLTGWEDGAVAGHGEFVRWQDSSQRPDYLALRALNVKPRLEPVLCSLEGGIWQKSGKERRADGTARQSGVHEYSRSLKFLRSTILATCRDLPCSVAYLVIRLSLVVPLYEIERLSTPTAAMFIQ